MKRSVIRQMMRDRASAPAASLGTHVPSQVNKYVIPERRNSLVGIAFGFGPCDPVQFQGCASLKLSLSSDTGCNFRPNS